MANKKKVEITSPIKNYCGVGAGGVQFAYGKAIIENGWIANWYREHGYEVNDVKDPK